MMQILAITDIQNALSRNKIKKSQQHQRVIVQPKIMVSQVALQHTKVRKVETKRIDRSTLAGEVLKERVAGIN